MSAISQNEPQLRNSVARKERPSSWLVSVGAAFGLLATAIPVSARDVQDATGRTLSVPDRVERVFPAGPPTGLVLYSLAPDKMLG